MKDRPWLFVFEKVEDRYRTMTEVVAELEKCQAAFSGLGTGSTLTRSSSGPTVADAEPSERGACQRRFAE